MTVELPTPEAAAALLHHLANHAPDGFWHALRSGLDATDDLGAALHAGATWLKRHPEAANTQIRTGTNPQPVDKPVDNQ